MKKVFVSGCFDMLHSGHVCFLEQAARYGDLYVGIGSDQTIKQLKGSYTASNVSFDVPDELFEIPKDYKRVDFSLMISAIKQKALK